MNNVRNGILFACAVLALGFVIVAGAWTDAPLDPPSDNIAAPINVGDIFQIKEGGLQLRGLFVEGKGVFSTSTYSIPSNTTLAVNGAVSANTYCDVNGMNCKSSSDVGGAAAGAAGVAKAWVTFRNINGAVAVQGTSHGVTSVASAAGVPNHAAWDTVITLDQPLLASNYAVLVVPSQNDGSARYNGTVLDWVCMWNKVASNKIGVHCAYPGYGAYGNSIASVVVFSQ